MQRRALVSTLGCSLLAGCASFGGDSSSPTTTAPPDPDPSASFSESLTRNGYSLAVTVGLDGAERVEIKRIGQDPLTTILSDGTYTVPAPFELGETVVAEVPRDTIPLTVAQHSVGSQEQPTYPSQVMGMGGSTGPDESVEGTYERTFQQRVGRYPTTFGVTVPERYYEYYESRHRFTDYGAYVSDQYDDPLIQRLTDELEAFGRQNGLSDRQVVNHAVAVVQNMEYTADRPATGYNEYPKFPVETLVDRGGDCEDTCILLAQLLGELGHDTVLLGFPEANHMALGVAGDSSIDGAYYDYDDRRYYYLETTAGGWEVGQVPAEIQEQNPSAEIYEVDQSPVLVFSWEASVRTEGSGGAEVEVQVRNVGDAPARNSSVVVEFESPGQGVVASSSRQLSSIEPQGETTQTVLTHPPDDQPIQGRVALRLGGELHDVDESSVQEPVSP